MGQLQNWQQLLMPTRANTTSCSRPDTTTNVHKRSPLAPVLSQTQLLQPQEHTTISCPQSDTTSPHLIYIVSFHFITNIGNIRLY